MSVVVVCGWCRREGGHAPWCNTMLVLPARAEVASAAGSSDRVRKLEAIASVAHEILMRGGRPGRIQAMARALAAAGYDVGQGKA